MVKNIYNLIKLWRMKHFSLEEKITIFKSLAISQTGYLALLTLIPNYVLEEVKQIRKTFKWGNKRANIKQDTLCNNFTEDGFKVSRGYK